MKKLLLIIFLLVVALSATYARSYLSDDFPPTIQVGDKEYPFNLAGIKLYVNSLKFEDPQLYEELNTMVRKIENQKQTYLWWCLGLEIGGAVAMTSGYAIFMYDLMTKDELEFGWGGGLAIGGLLAMVGGIIPAVLAVPNKSDVNKFINQHNKMNPQHSIQVGLNDNNDLKLALVFSY